MTTLLLRLTGPLQAWGSSSRFVRRTTESHPTKSGVIGLLAAAVGRRRTDPIEDLLALRFGVRLDRPGELVRDFQTARSLDKSRAMPLSTRYYLSDAAFLAGIQGDSELIGLLEDALRHPAFPLYLGRRSCPPVGPVVAGVRDDGLWDALVREPAIHSPARRRRTPAGPIEIVIDLDAAPTGVRERGAVATVRDVPLSFDPERREYGWREVVRAWVDLEGVGDASPTVGTGHDPMALLGG